VADAANGSPNRSAQVIPPGPPKSDGQTWPPGRQPVDGVVHDFPDPAERVG